MIINFFKKFFKPDRKRILLTLVLFIPIFTIQNLMFWTSNKFEQLPLFDLGFIITDLFLFYLWSCILIYIWNKNRRKNK